MHFWKYRKYPICIEKFMIFSICSIFWYFRKYHDIYEPWLCVCLIFVYILCVSLSLRLMSVYIYFVVRLFGARCSGRAIAMMFVRLSVCLSGTGMHCNHTVQFSADLSLRLDSPMFLAPWHQSMSIYSQPSFSSSTWKRGGVRMCKLGEALNANTDK